MTATVSLHLDTLVWDLHVGQLVKDRQKHLWPTAGTEWFKHWQIVTYLRSEANERHVGVAHGYEMSQLLVEGTHFSRPLRFLWLWFRLVPRHLQNISDGNKSKDFDLVQIIQLGTLQITITSHVSGFFFAVRKTFEGDLVAMQSIIQLPGQPRGRAISNYIRLKMLLLSNKPFPTTPLISLWGWAEH